MLPVGAIPVLCGAGRVAPSCRRRIHGAAPQTLLESDAECLAETMQEGAIHVFQKYSMGNSQGFQDTRPQSLMRKKRRLPAVEGGSSDTSTSTDLLYAFPAKEAREEELNEKERNWKHKMAINQTVRICPKITCADDAG